jgi:hypothetical protein
MTKLLVLAVFASGCLILPTRETSVTIVAEQRDSVAGATGDLELHTHVAADQVHVTAMKVRVCSTDIIQTVDVRHYRGSEVKTAFFSSDYGAPAAAALADAMMAVTGIATGLVSGLVTATIVVASKDTTTRERRWIHGTDYACPVPTRVPVEVTLTSGALLYGVTDPSGVFTASLNGDNVKAVRAEGQPEPERRDVSNTDSPSEDREHRQVHAFTAVRDALRGCGAKYKVSGIVAAQLEIDSDGHVTASPDIGGEEFATCVRDGIAEVRFPPGVTSKVVFPYRL